jgi:cephalosporin hydroxylase
MRLQELGLKYATTKATMQGFCDLYEKFIGDKPVACLIEIGIAHGASLRMWADYFTEASIIGIDNNLIYQVNEGRIKSYIADQGKVSTIVDLVFKHDPDIFIDDGSHIWSHQINTHKAIFPLLKPGAIYILEDLCTSLPIYFDEYADIPEKPTDYIIRFLEQNPMRHHLHDSLHSEMCKRDICVMMEKPLA